MNNQMWMNLNRRQNNDDLLQEHVYNGIIKLLDNYRQEYPNHVRYIENEIKNGNVDIDIIVQTVYNSGRVIDNNGRIDFETMGRIINDSIVKFLHAVEGIFMKSNNASMRMGGNMNPSSYPVSHQQTSMFPDIQPSASPFDTNHVSPREETFTPQKQEPIVTNSKENISHLRLNKKQQKQLDLMTKENLFTKGFTVDKTFSLDKGKLLASIIIATTKNYTCNLSEIICQFHACHVNGFMKYVDEDINYILKIEFDDTRITGKTDGIL